MKRRLLTGFWVLFWLFIFWESTLSTAENQPFELRCGQTFYADQSNRVMVFLGENAIGKRFSWRLTYLNRTIAAKEVVVPDSGIALIDFNYPKLNPGVIATAELTLNIDKTQYKQPLFFYPPNPFEFGKEQLKKFKIGVWHPEENTVLPDLLTKLKVPFEPVDDIGNYSGKVLLITGMDFSEYSGIEETLLRLCKNGTRIIISAPLGGPLPLKPSVCQRLVFDNNKIISKINKKFDAKYWGTKPPTTKGIKLIPYDDGVALEIVDGAAGFTYYKVGIGKGSVIIATWDLAKRAKESPTPLYLLNELIRK